MNKSKPANELAQKSKNPAYYSTNQPLSQNSSEARKFLSQHERLKFLKNGWKRIISTPSIPGIGGRFVPELVAGMERNTQTLSFL
jgi:hypothetical protein